jgi:AraC family transcriptional regulator
MNLRIETLSEKKLIGKRIEMSMSENKTVQLWLSFMPLRKTIKDSLTSDLFSMQVYDPSFDFRDFDSEVFF